MNIRGFFDRVRVFAGGIERAIVRRPRSESIWPVPVNKFVRAQNHKDAIHGLGVKIDDCYPGDAEFRCARIDCYLIGPGLYEVTAYFEKPNFFNMPGLEFITFVPS